MASDTTPMVLAEGHKHTMALDQSALLEALEALKAAEADDRIRQAAETIYQALIDAELAQGSARSRTSAPEPHGSPRGRGHHRLRQPRGQPPEQLNKEIKRRTNVVGVFPNPAALPRLADTVLAEAHDEWRISERRSR